jgi:hypothetical protein
MGTLTVDVNPSLGDTMTIDTKVFTFVPSGTANGDGEIAREAALGDTQENIVSAILGTDGHNDPHPTAWCQAAFIGDNLVVRALVGGVKGNDIATTETFTAGSNVFGAGNLINGADCIAADAVAALVAAITAEDTQGVGAAPGDPDTVVLTADVAGIAGDDIAVAETLANGAFFGAAEFLTNGIDGTVADARTVMMNSTWLYVAIADNTVADKNWRRIALGNAY